MSDKEKLEALARVIATELRGAPRRPRMRVLKRDDVQRLVTPSPAPPGMDAITRDAYFARIRDRARMYWLQWIVRQECHHHGRQLEELDDDQLIVLARKMEQAWECRVEGIAFDEVPGLVREGTVAT